MQIGINRNQTNKYPPAAAAAAAAKQQQKCREQEKD